MKLCLVVEPETFVQKPSALAMDHELPVIDCTHPYY